VTEPYRPSGPLDPVAARIAEAVLLDDNWVNMTTRPAAAMRAAKDRALAGAPRGPEIRTIRDVAVPLRGGGTLPLRLYGDSPAPRAILLWLHGGGFTLGNIASWDMFCRQFARRLDGVIALPEYRLAPEHPFPAGLHDTIDTLRWCASEAGREILGNLPLVVGGDSAGGNLATVALRRLRGEVKAAAQVLAYPCTDDVSSPLAQRFEPPFLGLKELGWFYDQYCPAGPGRLDPDVSPLRAADLTGMPPTLVVTAEHDLLTEQGEAYGRALAAAGAPVTMLRYAGMIHGFLSLDPFYPAQAGDAMTAIANFVTQAIEGRGPPLPRHRQAPVLSRDAPGLTPAWFTGAGGLQLAADIGGPPEGPPVIFLHGGGQTRRAWRSAALAMATSGRRAISLDLRGHGESEWSPDRLYVIERYVADLDAVLGQIGPKPALVGASLGGLTALTCIGESDADKAQALVLADVTPRMNQDGVERIRSFMVSRPDGFASLDEVVEALAEYNPNRDRPANPESLRSNLRETPDGRLRWHWDPGMFDDYRLDPGTLAPRYEAAARRITLPVLLVRGTASDVVDDAAVEAFRRLMPAAETHDVGDAGHMVAGDRNDAFNRAILDFLDRHQPVTPPPA